MKPNPQELNSDIVGIIFSFMNAFGNLVGVALPSIILEMVGEDSTNFEGWKNVFIIMAGLTTFFGKFISHLFFIIV